MPIDYAALVDQRYEDDQIDRANKRLMLDPRTQNITVSDAAQAKLVNDSNDPVSVVPQLALVSQGGQAINKAFSQYDALSTLDKLKVGFERGYKSMQSSTLYAEGDEYGEKAKAGVAGLVSQETLDDIDPKYREDFEKVVYDPKLNESYRNDMLKQQAQKYQEAADIREEVAKMPLPPSLVSARLASQGQGFFDTAGTYFSNLDFWGYYDMATTSVGAIAPELATTAALSLVGSPALGALRGAKSIQAIARALPVVSATLFGTGSYRNEYGNTIVDKLQDRGVDVSNPQAIINFQNEHPDEYHEITLQAHNRALVVGAMDAVSGHVASYMITPGDVIRGTIGVINKARGKPFMSPSTVVGKYGTVVDTAGAMSKAGLAKTMARSTGDFIQNLGTQATIEGVLGGTGEALGSVVAGDQIDPSAVFEEFIGEFVGSGPEVITGMMRASATAQIDYVQAHQAKAAQAQFENLTNTVEEVSKSVNNPEVMSQLVEKASEGKNVHAFAQDLVENGSVEKLKAVNPELAQKIEAAAQEQADISIPLKDVLDVAAQDKTLAQSILYDSRTSVEGMSPRQADAFATGARAQIVQNLMQAVEDTSVDRETIKQAREELQGLHDQLTTAGHTERQAKDETEPWVMYLARTAKLLGKTPKEVMRTINLQVQRDEQGQAKIFRQSAKKSSKSAEETDADESDDSKETKVAKRPRDSSKTNQLPKSFTPEDIEVFETSDIPEEFWDSAVAQVQSVRETKRPEDGWAPVELTGFKIEQKEKNGPKTIKAKFKNIAYGFDSTPTGEDGKRKKLSKPIRMGVEWDPEEKARWDQQAIFLAKGIAQEIKKVVERYKAGDKEAIAIIKQAGWYRNMRTRLREEYGGFADFVADLLGATSPQTPVMTNWENTITALNGLSMGEYDLLMKGLYKRKLDLEAARQDLHEYVLKLKAEGMTNAAIQDDATYDKKRKAISALKKFPESLKPKKPNTDKKFGVNSDNVARVFQKVWRDIVEGNALEGIGATSPKANTFTGNLVGYTLQATIDVWAARFLQRLAGLLRIPPVAETGVSGELLPNRDTTKQFGIGQDAFAKAVDLIKSDPTINVDGMFDQLEPDDLQAIAWFIEKEIWTKNGWTTADGAGGSFEEEGDFEGIPDKVNLSAVRQLYRSSLTPNAIKEHLKELLETIKSRAYRLQAGLSLSKSLDSQGVDYTPTDEQQRLYATALVRNLKLTDPDNKYIVAVRANTTVGYYGGEERSFDYEVVARDGYNPADAMQYVVRVAQANQQDSVLFSRVVKKGETVDPLRHRPGIEVYFKVAKPYSDINVLLNKLASLGMSQYTVITDTDPMYHGDGSMPNVVGIRYQFAPEMEERYGGTASNGKKWSELTDDEIEQEIEQKGGELSRISDKIALDVDEVSVSQLFWYESSVLFSNDYEDFLNGRTAIQSTGLSEATLRKATEGRGRPESGFNALDAGSDSLDGTRRGHEETREGGTRNLSVSDERGQHQRITTEEQYRALLGEGEKFDSKTFNDLQTAYEQIDAIASIQKHTLPPEFTSIREGVRRASEHVGRIAQIEADRKIQLASGQYENGWIAPPPDINPNAPKEFSQGALDDAEIRRIQADARAEADQLDREQLKDVLDNARTEGFRNGRSQRQAGHPKYSERGSSVYRREPQPLDRTAQHDMDRSGTGRTPVVDEGRSGGYDSGLRLLTPVARWTSGKNLSTLLERIGALKDAFNKLRGKPASQSTHSPTYNEYPQTPETAAVFLRLLSSAKKTLGPAGACVEEKSMDELTGKDGSTFRFFLSEDGKSGFAIKNGDDLVSVFAAADANHGDALIECAIAAGARRLDCFNTILPKLYAKHGFRPVARIAFNREYAPYDWDYDFFAKGDFNHGEPDIVFMVLDDGRQEDFSSLEVNAVPLVTDYEEGERLQAEGVKAYAKNNENLERAVETPEFNQTASKSPARGGYSPVNAIDANRAMGGLIRLMETADKSTFLHESAHAWLDIYTVLARDIAERRANGDELTDGERRFLQTLGGFFQWGTREGVLDFDITDEDSVLLAAQEWAEMTLDQQRGMHELFAEGFEAYVMHGTSPSLAMTRIFTRFKRWLKDVYQMATKKPQPLSNEVRLLYDMLFVSESEATKAEDSLNMRRLFSPKSAIMKTLTPQEQAEYEAMVEQAEEETQLKIARAMSRAFRRYEKVYGNVRKEIEIQHQDAVKRAEEKIREQPRYGALSLIVEGVKNPDGTYTHYKMDADSLRRAGIAEESIADLTKRGWVATVADDKAVKVPVETLAETAGATSVRELVGDMIDIKDMSQAHDEAIAFVAQRVQEQYGKTIEELTDDTALIAAHNEARSRLLTAEYNILARRLGGIQLLTRTARELAIEKVNGMKFSELMPYNYLRAEKRCARDAEKALSKGDIETALKAKRGQIINHEMARIALEAKQSYEIAQRFVKRTLKSKTINEDFKALLEALVVRHSFTDMSARDRAIYNQGTPQSSEKLQELVERISDQGIPIEGIEEFLNTRNHSWDMTVAELEDFISLLKQVAHVGRNFEMHRLGKIQQSINDTVAEGKKEIREAADAQKREFFTNERTPDTAMAKVKDKLQKFFYNHLKIATWCRVFDQNRDDGFFWNLFIKSANDRANFENSMREQVTVKLQNVLLPLFRNKSPSSDPMTFEGLDRPLTYGNRLAIALNWGNDGNRQRLMGGDPQLTPEIIQQVLSSLTRKEWQAVELIWQIFEQFRPMIAAKEHRVYGVEPQWVKFEPFEVETADGEVAHLRGGYYPIKYDPRGSNRASKYSDAEQAKMDMQGAFQSATTRRSFTKSRAEKVDGMPLRLDMVALYEGINDVIHDLAWHEWLIDTKRVLDGMGKERDNGLRAAIKERYGYNVARAFDDWRKEVAAGGRVTDPTTDAVLGFFTRNVGIATMGYSVTSAIVQLTGIGYVLPRVGPVNLARGMVKLLSNPLTLSQEIGKKSEFMRLRYKTQFKEIADIRNKIEAPSKFKFSIREHAYTMLQWVQSIVDSIAWQSAYDMYINDGYDEEKSIALADQVVYDTQSSGNLHAQAQVESAQVYRLFTTFYSWANAALNMTVAEKMGENNRPKAIAKILWMSGIMPILDALFRSILAAGGDDDDDEDPQTKLVRLPLSKVIEYNMGLLVGVREVANTASAVVAGERAFAYSGPAAIKGFVNLNDAFAALGKDQASASVGKAYINLAGTLLGIPSVQINRTIKGIRAIQKDKVDGVLESTQALVFGYDGRVQ